MIRPFHINHSTGWLLKIELSNECSNKHFHLVSIFTTNLIQFQRCRFLALMNMSAVAASFISAHSSGEAHSGRENKEYLYI